MLFVRNALYLVLCCFKKRSLFGFETFCKKCPMPPCLVVRGVGGWLGDWKCGVGASVCLVGNVVLEKCC